MYELLVLSLLMHWPLHAYRLAKIANEIIGPEERISAGTLSSLLAKLEHAGLIQPADPGRVPFPTDRPSRVFAITALGRERFFELMIDTTSHPGLYRRLFHIKALHLEFLAEEQQFLLVERSAYGQQVEDWDDESPAGELYEALVEAGVTVGWSSEGFCGIPYRNEAARIAAEERDRQVMWQLLAQRRQATWHA